MQLIRIGHNSLANEFKISQDCADKKYNWRNLSFIQVSNNDEGRIKTEFRENFLKFRRVVT